MSEMEQDVDALPQQAPEAANQPSAGALLTQLRESAGMHLAALAATLKVPESKLAALEADQYDVFAEPVFMRALASSVCRVLQADPAPVLARLPSGKPAPLRVDHGLNAAFKEPGGRKPGAGGTLEQPKSRALGLVVVALLVGAVGMVFYPRARDVVGATQQPASHASANTSVAEPEVIASAAPAASVVTAAPQAPEPATAPAAAPKDVPQPVAAPNGVSGVPAPVAPAPVTGVATGAAADQGAAVVAAPGDATLLIRATGQSWIQVRGTDGKVVLEKLLVAGQSVTVPGAPPWSVVVGKADVTEVLVRGKTMDLAAIARENVARFEVK